MIKHIDSPATLLVVLLGTGLMGCQTTEPRRDAIPPATIIHREFQPAAGYLEYAHRLVAATPDEQRLLFRQAANEYQTETTSHNKLRYALALNLLPPPNGDSGRAHTLFKELTALPRRLPWDIEPLVLIQQTAASQKLEMEARLITQKKELEKAGAQIRALTNIEQTLEQPAKEAPGQK